MISIHLHPVLIYYYAPFDRVSVLMPTGQVNLRAQEWGPLAVVTHLYETIDTTLCFPESRLHDAVPDKFELSTSIDLNPVANLAKKA